MSMTEGLEYDPEAVVKSDKFEINAPDWFVWEIICDVDNYPRWNPFCVEAESTLEMGAPLKMKLQSYIRGMEDVIFDNTEFICHNEAPKQISWELPDSDFWPYPARRNQYIETTGAESCTYWSDDIFYGDNGIHVMRFAGPWVTIAFNDTGKCLKKYAEDLYLAKKYFDKAP